MRNQNEGNLEANVPNYVIGLSREIHISEPGGEESPIQIAITYSNGFGRELLTKVQAEPGDAPVYNDGDLVLDGNGNPELGPTDTRWVGNGRTVFNNKGLPVHQYEPFFDSHPFFTDNEALIEIGVTPTLEYDPLGRNTRTLLPDGSITRVEFSPWFIRTFDPIDTVSQDNENEWFQSYNSEVLPPEIADIFGGNQAQIDRLIQARQRTAQKVLALNDTPTVQHLDSLGRPFVSIAHNRFDYRDDANTNGEYYLPNHSFLDIEGNPQEIWDGRNSENIATENAAITFNQRGQTNTGNNGNLVVNLFPCDEWHPTISR